MVADYLPGLLRAKGFDLANRNPIVKPQRAANREYVLSGGL